MLDKACNRILIFPLPKKYVIYGFIIFELEMTYANFS